jgi:hypothetical protein
MVKATFNTTVRNDDFPKPGGVFSQRFISNLSNLHQVTYDALNNGLTVADNWNAVWLSPSLSHGVATAVANPLRGNCAPKQIAVYPGAQPIRSYSWTYSASTNAITMTVNYDVTTGTIVSTSQARSAGTSLSTGVSANVCSSPSITLTGGDWEIGGYVGFNPGGATNINYAIGAISKTSATTPANDTRGLPTNGEVMLQEVNIVCPGSTYDTELSFSPYQLKVASGSSVTLYLVANSAFSVSTLTAFGYLKARLMGAASGLTDTPTVLVYGG